MTTRSLLMAAAVGALLVPAAASAQAPSGIYVGGAAGVSLPNDSDLEGPAVGVFPALNTSADLNTGAAINFSVGYRFDMGLRPELEFGWKRNSVDDIGGNSASGSVRSLSAMANLLYDIPAGMGDIYPYVGAGIGLARVSFDNVSQGGETIDDKSTDFAYQGIAGLGYRLSDTLDLSLDYRYFAVPDIDVNSNRRAVDTEYRSHLVMLGLRYTFAAPKPAPVAAPAPPPPPPPAPPVAAPAPQPPAIPRNYLVFFDFDKSDLTVEARGIINTAANNAKAGRVTRIELTGHTDRAGSNAYNQRLSQRRADAVKAELQRLGIAANQIVTFAKGETSPLVPTADGVREPQNRRVEIVFP
ncbi:MAG: OmpA family protein [Thalassobaculales bacterium]